MEMEKAKVWEWRKAMATARELPRAMAMARVWAMGWIPVWERPRQKPEEWARPRESAPEWMLAVASRHA